MADQTRPNTYMQGYKHVAHHEMRTAENCATYMLPSLQAAAKEKQDLRLLDIGAGSGTITASMVKYMPNGSITAVDISDEILQRAAAYAKQAGIDNITFQQANIYELPFKDNSFDVVHAHQVLCHLAAPIDAMREMIRVCKPGGFVASREADMRMWCFHPAPPGLIAFHRLIRGTMAEAGGHPDAGPLLVSWAMAAGAKRENIHATYGTWSYSTSEERQVWGGSLSDRVSNGEMRKKALEKGLATEAEMEEMIKGWEEWIAAEDGSMGCMHGEVIVRK